VIELVMTFLLVRKSSSTKAQNWKAQK